jgi:hypothetical protein
MSASLNQAAIAADDAWGEELRRIYRNNACNVRYTKAGRGEPGSNLRRLYENREAARVAWENSLFGAKKSFFV